MSTHPGAIIAHGAASSQAGVEIGNAIRAADWSVLMDPAATVHVATTRQIPVSHREGRTAKWTQMETLVKNKRRLIISIYLTTL